MKINAVLVPFSHPDATKLVEALKTTGVGYSAVTMPHKGAVIPLIDSVDKDAKAVGAVNTILNKDGKLSGYNTDLDGIRYALRSARMKGKNVLIVGAGGAAAAVSYVVKKARGKAMYTDRTREKAELLKKRFGGRVVDIEKLTAKDIDVIVHATPVGQHPHTNQIAIPKALIAKHQLVFDLVYNPLQTLLLKTAKKKGARTVSGLDMFIVQGMRQVELSTGKRIIKPAYVEKLKRAVAKTL